MTKTKTAETSIEDFKPSKKYLLCVDSDGCVMDSMTKKHKLCFGPLMIREWNLDEYEKEILPLWEKVNLYSKTRGVNRFKGLAIVLKEVNAKYMPVVGIGHLLHWTESEELSEASLMRKIEANHEITIFKKALAWSRAVNRATAELGEGLITPFDGVKNALEYAHKFADIAVVSGADPAALYDEWLGHGLLCHADLLLAQNAGSKSHCIEKLLKKGYENTSALMCGDAIGDLFAAEQNKIHFYPIPAGNEEECWYKFNTVFDAFMRGDTAALCEAKRKFSENGGNQNG